MKKIIAYLLISLLLFVFLFIIHDLFKMPLWYTKRLIFAKCAYIGGIGGILYCLRAVYLNRCVLKQWDADWQVWYYLRPITSTISGFISCIFLKAGLLVLEASSNPGNTPYGYISIALIAGYNVDNFMKKIESIAQTVWGISKSRVSSNNNDKA